MRVRPKNSGKSFQHVAVVTRGIVILYPLKLPLVGKVCFPQIKGHFLVFKNGKCVKAVPDTCLQIKFFPKVRKIERKNEP